MVEMDVYSRADSLADGELRDAGELAREVGFRVPVALTRAVWAECVAVPEACPWQDETGRLWDVLWMASLAARAHRGESRVPFVVCVQNEPGEPVEVPLVMHCTPGDDLEPVVTIALPGED